MGWTDWNTRAMLVDFSFYNAGTRCLESPYPPDIAAAGINKFAIVRVLFEINISGAVITDVCPFSLPRSCTSICLPQVYYNTVKLFRYSTILDYVVV